MKNNISHGKCQLCGNIFARKDMTRHLKACSEIGPERQEYKMDVELGKILPPGMKFFHEYDFGTPTELSLLGPNWALKFRGIVSRHDNMFEDLGFFSYTDRRSIKQGAPFS